MSEDLKSATGPDRIAWTRHHVRLLREGEHVPSGFRSIAIPGDPENLSALAVRLIRTEDVDAKQLLLQLAPLAQWPFETYPTALTDAEAPVAHHKLPQGRGTCAGYV